MVTDNLGGSGTAVWQLAVGAPSPVVVIGGSPAIAKAGTPLVRVARLEAPVAPRRLGFLVGEIVVPDDFDRMGEVEIANLFGANA